MYRSINPDDNYDELGELENYMAKTSEHRITRHTNSNVRQPATGREREKKVSEPGTKQEECPECEDKFSDLKSLSEHFDAMHEDSDGECNVQASMRTRAQMRNAGRVNYEVKSIFSENTSENKRDLKPAVVREKVDVNSNADLAKDMRKEIMKRIEENAAKKLISLKSTETVEKEKVYRRDHIRNLDSVIRNAGNIPGDNYLAPSSSSSRTPNRNSMVKKRTELASISRSSVVADKLSQTLTKIVQPNESKLSKNAKLSQLQSLGVSVGKIKSSDERESTSRRSANKVPKWMKEITGSADDVIEIEDEVLELKPKKKEVLKIRPRYVFDSRIRMIKDVATAKVPGRSQDQFLNSFLAFYHGKDEKDHAESALVDVEALNYSRPEVRIKRTQLKLWDRDAGDDDKEGDVSQEDLDEDLLLDHIKKNNLPLIKRKPTLSDGNCWYDAAADQVVLHDIPNKARDHQSLRAEVCKTLLSLPQTPAWVQNIFSNSQKRFRKFLARHKRTGQWTDNSGIMCQATALYLDRNIHIVGTANYGHAVGFTKLEGATEASKFPPLYIGYYQDLHYQSLEEVKEVKEPNESIKEMDVGITQLEKLEASKDEYDQKEVLKEKLNILTFMSDILEEVLEKVFQQIERNLSSMEIEVRVKKSKKGCKIMPIRPYKSPVQPVVDTAAVEIRRGPPRSQEELENQKKAEAKIDTMIQMISSKIKPIPNDVKLEIFQNLQKANTILEFNTFSSGTPLTPKKNRQRKTILKTKKLKPLQQSMGRVLTPKKFRVDISKKKVKVKEKKVISTDSPRPQPQVPFGPPGPAAPPGPPGPPGNSFKNVAAIPPIGPPGHSGQIKTAETTIVDDPPVTHILDVYKCIKCNHAFEKINLFVKHFIKAHKDVINANRNSKSFSFSNFWTKMKVKASTKKKLPQPSEPITIADDEPCQSDIVPPQKAVQPLPTVPFGTRQELKTKETGIEDVKSDSEEEFIDDGNEHDLQMEVESGISVVECLSNISRDKWKPVKHTKFEFGEGLEQTLIPEDSGSFVWDVEDQVLSDVDEFKIIVEKGKEFVIEATPINKYQTIPIAEIKVENPFEELPFEWNKELDVLNATEDNELKENQLKEVVVYSDDEEEFLLGLSSEALVVVDILVGKIISRVVSMCERDDTENEDILEMFHEEVHDITGTSISHQVYVKDFDWIPLEDQFKDCAEKEKEDIQSIFEIKKIKCEDEKKEAVKKMMLKNENSDITKDYIRRIIDEKYLPEEADHNQNIPALPRIVGVEHDYFKKPSSIQKSKPVPSHITKMLTKLKSKVNILPASAENRARKSAFVGVRSVPIKVTQNNIIRVSLGKKEAFEDIKPTSEALATGRRRIEIIALDPQKSSDTVTLGKKKYLDEYLVELYAPKVDPVNAIDIMADLTDISIKEKLTDVDDTLVDQVNNVLDHGVEGTSDSLEDPSNGGMSAASFEATQKIENSHQVIAQTAIPTGIAESLAENNVNKLNNQRYELSQAVKIEDDGNVQGEEKNDLKESSNKSSKSRREKKKWIDEPKHLRKRKTETEEEKIDNIKKSRIIGTPTVDNNVSSSLEELTEKSLEETLRCLEDLLQNENFAEPVVETEIKSNGNDRDIGRNKEFNIKSISSVSNNNAKENKDLFGRNFNSETRTSHISEVLVERTKSKGIQEDINYEREAEKAREVNNLEEPPCVNIPVRFEEEAEVEEIIVSELVSPVISEYNIKQEPEEETEVTGCVIPSDVSIPELNFNDYNIKQEVIDESIEGARNIAMSIVSDGQFRVDEYNIKKEVVDNEIDVVASNISHTTTDSTLLNPLLDYINSGWMTDIGIKAEPPVKHESQATRNDNGGNFTPVQTESDDEVMIVETVVNNAGEACDILENVIRCKECFKSFQSNPELMKHSMIHEKLSVEEFASQKVTQAKFDEIQDSKFPKINLARVSLKNHEYIQTSNLNHVDSKSTLKKPESISKITTLQALDGLFAPTKSSNSKHGARIKPSDSDVKMSASKTFMKEIDKVFEMSTKLSHNQKDNVKPYPKVQSSGTFSSSIEQSTKTKKTLLNLKSFPKIPDGPPSSNEEYTALTNKVPGLLGLQPENTHSKSKHKSSQPKKSVPAAFTCQVCLKVNFNTMDALRKHLSYHPHSLCKEKVNICYICDEKFDLEDTSFNVHLIRHLQKMKNSVTLKCLGCYSVFEGKEKLMSHVVTVHEKSKSFPCPACPKFFDRKRQLLLHITTMHEATSREIIEKET